MPSSLMLNAYPQAVYYSIDSVPGFR